MRPNYLVKHLSGAFPADFISIENKMGGYNLKK